MAVQSLILPVVNYQPISRGIPRHARSTGTNIRSVNSDQSLAIASKAAFEANMERALTNKKYWDELLEKLRKSGGGGGGSNDSRFDRIAVSMMLTNFLSNKAINAMLRNFAIEFLKLVDNFSNRLQGMNQNPIVTGFQKFGTVIVSGIANIISLIVRRDAATLRLYDVSRQISAFAQILSFQLNKLKRILEEDLKELIRKLDVKEKIKKIKAALLDFFVEMKETILNVIVGFMLKSQVGRKSDLLLQNESQ